MQSKQIGRPRQHPAALYFHPLLMGLAATAVGPRSKAESGESESESESESAKFVKPRNGKQEDGEGESESPAAPRCPLRSVLVLGGRWSVAGGGSTAQPASWNSLLAASCCLLISHILYIERGAPKFPKSAE